jgi:hypothetical protein
MNTVISLLIACQQGSLMTTSHLTIIDRAPMAQVIYGAWAAFPPSAWFSPEKPLAFTMMACLVLSSTTAAAWLHHRAWSAAKVSAHIA